MNTECVSCFKNLSIGSRADIYMYIAGSGPKNVNSITTQLGLTQPTVSYHLKKMKETGLLSSKKIGKEVVFSINNNCPHSKDKKTCVVN